MNEKIIDTKTKDLAILANDSYTDEIKFNKIDKRKKLSSQNQDIIKYKDNVITGFRAKAYKNNDTGEIIIAYAGTNSFKDLQADAKLASGVKPSQLDEAIAFYKDTKAELLKDGLNSKITLTGHSLGGMLAIITALDNYNEQMKKLGGVNKENFIKMKSQDNPLEVVTFESPNVIMSSEYGNQIYNDYKDILDLFGYICSPTDSLGILSQSREDTRLFRRAMN